MTSQPQQPSWAVASSSTSVGPLSVSALDNSKSQSRSPGSTASHTASPLHTSSTAGPSNLSVPQGRTATQAVPGRTDKGKGALHTIAPGSSSQGQSGAGAQSQAKVKRKRDGEGKRKKVAKACLVCQKSHLTCDESESFTVHRK
jgi:hypothetical protein